MTAYRRLPGHREFGVFDTNPPTPYFHYAPVGASRARVLVVHGLDASKNVLNVFSYALADAGFEVFAIDLPGHGDSRAAFTGLGARDAVEQVLIHLGPGTLVVGHSLGGALLLDLANERRIPAMVLFSPAPTPLEKVHADRVLVLEGEFDPGRIRAFADVIRAAATGSVEVRDMTWTGHSGGLLRPRNMDAVIVWFGGSAEKSYTQWRFAALALGWCSGLAAAAVTLGSLPVQSEKLVVAHSAPVSILHYAVAAMIATVLNSLFGLFSWLHLYATHYLIGVLSVTGLLLAVLYRASVRMKSSPHHLLVALAATAYVVALLSVIGSEFAAITVAGDRWWRFPAIALLSLPLFIADEALLRPRRPKWKAAAMALVTRVILGATIVTGGLILYREAAFLLLMMPAVVLFWIALWFGGQILGARTDSVSVALFAALLQAWVFSALFVTT